MRYISLSPTLKEKKLAEIHFEIFQYYIFSVLFGLNNNGMPESQFENLYFIESNEFYDKITKMLLLYMEALFARRNQTLTHWLFELLFIRK